MTRPTFPCDLTHIVGRLGKSLDLVETDGPAAPAPEPAPDITDPPMTPEALAALDFEPWGPGDARVPSNEVWDALSPNHLTTLRIAEKLCAKTKPQFVEAVEHFAEQDHLDTLLDLLEQTRETFEHWVSLCHGAEARIIVAIGVIRAREAGR